jgi:hypothetical protein
MLSWFCKKDLKRQKKTSRHPSKLKHWKSFSIFTFFLWWGKIMIINQVNLFSRPNRATEREKGKENRKPSKVLKVTKYDFCRFWQVLLCHCGPNIRIQIRIVVGSLNMVSRKSYRIFPFWMTENRPLESPFNHWEFTIDFTLLWHQKSSYSLGTEMKAKSRIGAPTS